MKRSDTALVFILLVFFGANAWACGDSLYRVGKGVSYRVYTAPLPGNVLVYGSSEAAEELAAKRAERKEALTAYEKAQREHERDLKRWERDVVEAQKAKSRGEGRPDPGEKPSSTG